MSQDHNHHHHDDEEHIHPEPTSFWTKYVFSTDHKVIAKQFLFFGLFWGIIGFYMSYMIRWAIAHPAEPLPIFGKLFFPFSNGIIPPDTYVSLFTMHGTIMIFFAITPILIGCFGNLLIPLMIGARDMIFPWLNMLSFWFIALAGVLMFGSFFVTFGPSAVGWTSYPTLAHSQWTPGWGHSLWLLSLFFLGLSSIFGAINYIVTIIRLRCPGMTYGRLPLSLWGIWMASILNAVFLPVLAGAFLLLLMDRTFGTQFFFAGAIAEVGSQGDPIAYQHLFWIFGHPEVYIVILPGWGIVGDLLSFFSRKPAFSYKYTVASLIAITVLSTVVYGHHMYTTGMTPLLTKAFATLTLIISIPSVILFVGWLGTLWKGDIHFTSPMWFSLGMIFTFGLGGLTGLHLGAPITDILLHNTYFVVGHFHLTMAAAALLAAFAGVYFWFPKMFGRMMNEGLAKIHFWMTFTPIVFIFVTQMFQGYQGFPRRYYHPYEYDMFKHLKGSNELLIIGVTIMAIGQIIFFYNFIQSYFAGKQAEANPWKVGTVEWSVPSPPAYYNFEKTPTVYHGPHEFSHPALKDRDWILQTEAHEGVTPSK